MTANTTANATATVTSAGDIDLMVAAAVDAVHSYAFCGVMGSGGDTGHWPLATDTATGMMKR